MLYNNSGDLRKARSNHWFFTYIPNAVLHPPHHQQEESGAASVPTGIPSSSSSSWRSYGCYLTFVTFGLLALYTQIVVVHPTKQAWQDVTLEAFGFQHVMAQSRHERLARKFHLKAQTDTVDGYKARIKAAHGEHDSQQDASNATKLQELVKLNREEAQSEKQEAEDLGEKASEEHDLYLEYLKNASFHQQRAEALKQEAERFANQSEHYHQIFEKYNSMVQEDEKLKKAYLQNSTWEGEVAENITRAEEDREDNMWVCRWGWSRQYVCGVFGGFTALGEADDWHQRETEDYQKAMDLQQQIEVEQAKAMIASTQAAQSEEEARLARLQTEEMHNTTVQDEISAAEERAMELEDLQRELEALKLAHEHLYKMEHYQALEVQLENQRRKEDEYSHGQWELGTNLLDRADAEQAESERQWDLANAEDEKQRELVERANKLGRRLRLFSTVAAAYALISLAFFIMALVTTNTVSLGYQLRTMAVALSVTLLRLWEGRNTNWEGRSILGDHQDRNCLRQLSCWFHHGLCFLVVAGIQGEQLSSLFEQESWGRRGDILLMFALTAGCLEALLFQAVPHASVLPSLTREYFRNVFIRFLSSTSRFAIQMLLLLILCGADSTWLFDCINFLHKAYIIWIMVLIITCSAHMCWIEYPYALSLDRNNGATMSDVTSSESISHYSRRVSLLQNSMGGGVDEEVRTSRQATIADLPQRNDANSEMESLLTVSRAQVPAVESMGSLPYSSISLRSTLTTEAASNPIFFPSPALQRLYEVSIQDEFFVILSYIELILLAGVLLVVCASLPNIAHR